MDNIKVKQNGEILTLTIDLSKKGEMTTKGTARKVASTSFWEKLDNVKGYGALSMQMVILRANKKIVKDDDADNVEEAKPIKNKKKVAEKSKPAKKSKSKAESTEDTEDKEVTVPVNNKKKRAA